MKYRDELLMIPHILRQVLEEKEEPCLRTAERIIFCGCGTSFYMGQQLANLMNVHGRQADAVSALHLIEAASEPEEGAVYVFISRSGNSLETVLAMNTVKTMGAKTFYLGCKAGSKLDVECDGSRVIPYAMEQLILESYSFYAQFLLAWRCCGFLCDRKIPGLVKKAFSMGDECFEKLYIKNSLKRVICLGAPFYMPFLREMMLKNGEITLLPVENWEILEFRHGPRCWVDENMLIYILPGIKSAVWDRRVAEELISYGCSVVYFFGEPLHGAQSVEFGTKRGSVEEIILIGAFIMKIAVQIGEELGTTPEQMRHVVHNVGEL